MERYLMHDHTPSFEEQERIYKEKREILKMLNEIESRLSLIERHGNDPVPVQRQVNDLLDLYEKDPAHRGEETLNAFAQIMDALPSATRAEYDAEISAKNQRKNDLISSLQRNIPASWSEIETVTKDWDIPIDRNVDTHDTILAKLLGISEAEAKKLIDATLGTQYGEGVALVNRCRSSLDDLRARIAKALSDHPEGSRERTEIERIFEQTKGFDDEISSGKRDLATVFSDIAGFRKEFDDLQHGQGAPKEDNPPSPATPATPATPAAVDGGTVNAPAGGENNDEHLQGKLAEYRTILRETLADMKSIVAAVGNESPKKAELDRIFQEMHSVPERVKAHILTIEDAIAEMSAFRERVGDVSGVRAALEARDRAKERVRAFRLLSDLWHEIDGMGEFATVEGTQALRSIKDAVGLYREEVWNGDIDAAEAYAETERLRKDAELIEKRESPLKNITLEAQELIKRYDAHPESEASANPRYIARIAQENDITLSEGDGMAQLVEKLKTKPEKEEKGPEAEEREELLISASSIASERHSGRNEDAYFQLSDKKVFGVFDGMGGHEAGDVASSQARDFVSAEFASMPEDLSLEETQDFIRDVLLRAGELVTTQSMSAGNHMGTTGTVAVIWTGPDGSSKVVIGNVGDSRVYLSDDKTFRQVTLDDSYLRTLVPDEQHSRALQDALNESESWDDFNTRTAAIPVSEDVKGVIYGNRNVVSQAIGLYDDQGPVSIEPRIETVDLLPGGRLLLCSDGVGDNLKGSEIQSLMERGATSDEIMNAALLRSREAHGANGEGRAKPDDMTALLIGLSNVAENEKTAEAQVHEKDLFARRGVIEREILSIENEWSDGDIENLKQELTAIDAELFPRDVDNVELSGDVKKHFEEDFGLAREDLFHIEVSSPDGKTIRFADLTPGRQLLLLKNLEQFAVENAKEQALKQFTEQEKEKSGKQIPTDASAGKLKRTYLFFRNLPAMVKKGAYSATLSTRRAYNVTGLEKNSLFDREGNKEVYEQFLRDMLVMSADGPEAVEVDGNLQFNFALEDDVASTPEAKAAITKFNEVAGRYTRMNLDWRTSEDEGERQRYEYLENEYTLARAELLKAKFDGDAFDAQMYVAGLDEKVLYNQVFNTYPGAEKEFARIGSRKAWWEGLKTFGWERGKLMTMGLVSRGIAVAGVTVALASGVGLGIGAAAVLTGAASGMIAGGWIGKVMARKRTNMELGDAEKLLAMGQKVDSEAGKLYESKETKHGQRGSMEDAGSLVSKLDIAIVRMEGGIPMQLYNDVGVRDVPLNPVSQTKERRAEQLVNRLYYSEERYDKGLISFGEGAEGAKNKYEFFRAIARARAALLEEDMAAADERVYKVYKIGEDKKPKAALTQKIENIKGVINEMFGEAKEKKEELLEARARLGMRRGAKVGVVMGGLLAGLSWEVAHAGDGDVGSVPLPLPSRSRGSMGGVSGGMVVPGRPTTVPDVVEGAVLPPVSAPAGAATAAEHLASAVKHSMEEPSKPHTVVGGDNVWNIIKGRLSDNDVFSQMSSRQQNFIIDSLKDRVAHMSSAQLKDIGIRSGDPGRIYPDDVIKFDKVFGDSDMLQKAFERIVTTRGTGAPSAVETAAIPASAPAARIVEAGIVPVSGLSVESIDNGIGLFLGKQTITDTTDLDGLIRRSLGFIPGIQGERNIDFVVNSMKEPFLHMTPEQLKSVGISSGNIDLVSPGDSVDFRTVFDDGAVFGIVRQVVHISEPVSVPIIETPADVGEDIVLPLRAPTGASVASPGAVTRPFIPADAVPPDFGPAPTRGPSSLAGTTEPKLSGTGTDIPSAGPASPARAVTEAPTGARAAGGVTEAAADRGGFRPVKWERLPAEHIRYAEGVPVPPGTPASAFPSSYSNWVTEHLRAPGHSLSRTTLSNFYSRSIGSQAAHYPEEVSQFGNNLHRMLGIKQPFDLGSLPKGETWASYTYRKMLEMHISPKKADIPLWRLLEAPEEGGVARNPYTRYGVVPPDQGIRDEVATQEWIGRSKRLGAERAWRSFDETRWAIQHPWHRRYLPSEYYRPYRRYYPR